MEECTLHAVIPQDSIVHAFVLSRDICQYLIVTPGITVTRGYVALRDNAVKIPSPWCDECCVMAIIRVQGSAVIAVPRIEDSFVCVGGN